MQATQTDFAVARLSTVVAPLLSTSMVATGALAVLPSSSTSLVISPYAILAAVASSSLYSRHHVLRDQLYTSSDADSLWGATYKPKQKILVGFVSAFDKNLIRSVGGAKCY